jgi:hypothetical protein
MYVKSPYPDPPGLPVVNVHRLFFRRPDQAEWADYTLHIDGVTGKRVMFREWLRDMEDLSTALAAPTSEGCMGLQGWGEGEGPEDVVPGGKEIIGIMTENSSVSAYPTSMGQLSRTQKGARMGFCR